MPITGECFCGEITYEVNSPLRDARCCHCSRCRKAFSLQSSAVAFLDTRDFQWVIGSSNLKSYVGNHGYGYQFCQTCGSALTIIFNNDVIGVTLGCVGEILKWKLVCMYMSDRRPHGKYLQKGFFNIEKDRRMHNNAHKPEKITRCASKFLALAMLKD